MTNILAIDFDGVIHKASEGYGDGTIYDEPTENAAFTIENLIKAGYEVVVFSTRDKSEYPAMREWLKKHNFPKLKLTNVKPKGVRAIIDNRAIRFTRWDDLYSYFL